MEGDKFYVLCDFVHESVADGDGQNSPVQVAYAEWITYGPNDWKPISNLIDEGTQVKLQWPANVDVQPKEVMQKKAADIKWIDVVAILKAQSDGM